MATSRVCGPAPAVGLGMLDLSRAVHAGKGMMAAVRDANHLRMEYPALRYGWSNCIHEDRMNGVMG